MKNFLLSKYQPIAYCYVKKRSSCLYLEILANWELAYLMLMSNPELKLVGSNVRLRFDFGTGSRVVSTHGRNYSDNTWHRVSTVWHIFGTGSAGGAGWEQFDTYTLHFSLSHMRHSSVWHKYAHFSLAYIRHISDWHMYGTLQFVIYSILHISIWHILYTAHFSLAHTIYVTFQFETHMAHFCLSHTQHISICHTLYMAHFSFAHFMQ